MRIRMVATFKVGHLQAQGRVDDLIDNADQLEHIYDQWHVSVSTRRHGYLHVGLRMADARRCQPYLTGRRTHHHAAGQICLSVVVGAV